MADQLDMNHVNLEDSEQDSTANEATVRTRRETPVREKNHRCTHEGCTKSYDRAEHLCHHMLNRQCVNPVLVVWSADLVDNPKQIHHCDFPNYSSVFARADLRDRHKERHTGPSQLSRKDCFVPWQTRL